MLLVKELLLLLAANTIIAAFLTSVDFGEGFGSNFIFSQCIGLTIYTCVNGVLRLSRQCQLIWQLIFIALALSGGAGIGILIGNQITGHGPADIFVNQYDVFIKAFCFSVLFGTIISFMFISRKRLNESRAEAQEEKIKRLDREKQMAEANLRLLQAQIEPHFLFNTLANVVSLIDSDKGKAKEMLHDFTLYLRTSLNRTRDEVITLGQEIEMIRSYLNIVKIRMNERLAYTIDVAQPLNDFPLPPMLLQPLVENAIQHGLEPSIDGGSISISGKVRDKMVCLEVADTGSGLENEKEGGVGLANVRDRLHSIYGGKGHLILEENKPCGLKVIIKIPVADYVG